VDSSQVGVLEERDEVCLGSLLESHDRARLEAQIRLEVLCDFTNQALEGELADEELCKYSQLLRDKVAQSKAAHQ